MEYANEGDLHIKIEKQKKQRSLMPEVEVWKIFIHLLYGLNELHTKNILHRDLKAENIFIGNGVYKIGDMNVSKIIKNGLACTQTGTPYYASP
jgi:NIMA (never in mitosis gene a)-related kinase